MAGALSKEEGLTDELTKVGWSIQNTKCRVEILMKSQETGTPHNVYTLIYTFRYKGSGEGRKRHHYNFVTVLTAIETKV